MNVAALSVSQRVELRGFGRVVVHLHAVKRDALEASSLFRHAGGPLFKTKTTAAQKILQRLAEENLGALFESSIGQ
jgi:hypothetical protein